MSIWKKPSHAEVETAFRAANERVAGANSWILLSSDRMTGAGICLFFDGKADLIKFLSEFPYLAGSPETTGEDEDNIELIIALLKIWKTRNLDETVVSALINELREQKEVIVWLGPVRRLLTDTQGFACQLREEFEISRKETSSLSIQNADMFIDYLRGWG